MYQCRRVSRSAIRSRHGCRLGLLLVVVGESWGRREVKINTKRGDALLLIGEQRDVVNHESANRAEVNRDADKGNINSMNKLIIL